MVRARDRSLHSEVRDKKIYYSFLMVLIIRIGLPNSFPELFCCDPDKTQLDSEDEEKSKTKYSIVCCLHDMELQSSFLRSFSLYPYMPIFVCNMYFDFIFSQTRSFTPLISRESIEMTLVSVI